MQRLLQILTVLLAGHIGFAQAGMVHVASAASTVAATSIDVPSEAAAVTQADDEAMPCHHHATADQQPESHAPHHDQHKDGCCSAGYCHCAAVCGLPSVSMTLSASIDRHAPGFMLRAAPSADGAPHLRPPIH